MEILVERDAFSPARDGQEGFTQGKLYINGRYHCETVEDEDRHLENGNGKIYGKTAIPRGRYEVDLYNSPKHGTVPLLKDVPGFKYIEIHKANRAEDLQGCIGVGAERFQYGVRNCAYVLTLLVQAVREARFNQEKVYITVR